MTHPYDFGRQLRQSNWFNRLKWNAMHFHTADIVRHKPTGEEWVVAFVRGDRLLWCGWPPGSASVADCELVRKGTAREREELLAKMAAIPGIDDRKTYAQRQLTANARIKRRRSRPLE